MEQNTRYLYIHLDLDVLDPDIFPAVKCPGPNGFNPKTVAKFIQQAINDYDVIGLSLTETTAETQQQLKPIEAILGVYKNYLTSEHPRLASLSGTFFNKCCTPLAIFKVQFKLWQFIKIKNQ